jgi:hypothetical protein
VGLAVVVEDLTSMSIVLAYSLSQSAVHLDPYTDLYSAVFAITL